MEWILGAPTFVKSCATATTAVLGLRDCYDEGKVINVTAYHDQGKTTIKCNSLDLADNIKHIVEHETKQKLENCSLFSNGNELRSGTLQENGVRDGSSIFVRKSYISDEAKHYVDPSFNQLVHVPQLPTTRFFNVDNIGKYFK